MLQDLSDSHLAFQKSHCLVKASEECKKLKLGIFITGAFHAIGSIFHTGTT